MAFISANFANSIGDCNYPCLYKAMDPYSHYASTTKQTKGTYSEHFHKYVTNFLVNGSSESYERYFWYPQSNQGNHGNEERSFPTVFMTTNADRQLLGATTASAMTQAFPLTTDYTGLLDAIDPVKCRKQVHPFYLRKRGNSVPAEGMTRTKDKYRVVYTEKQRIGLEREYKANKFITTKKRAEISQELDLSERQIKICFQNRRAKERRQKKKTDTETDHMSTEELSETGDLQNSDTGSDAVNRDLSGETDSFSHNYAYLGSPEESAPRNQCRFHHRENSACDSLSGSSHQLLKHSDRIYPTSPAEYYHLSSSSNQQHLGSPSEWCSTGTILNTSTVSPFTANPDWNLVNRS